MLRATVDGQRVILFDRCAWLRVLGADGLTLYRVLFFRRHRSQVSRQLFAHEMLHWERWVSEGLIAFAWHYLRDLVRYGYRRHPEEVRAYALEQAASQSRTTWTALYDAWRSRV